MASLQVGVNPETNPPSAINYYTLPRFIHHHGLLYGIVLYHTIQSWYVQSCLSSCQPPITHPEYSRQRQIDGSLGAFEHQSRNSSRLLFLRLDMTTMWKPGTSKPHTNEQHQRHGADSTSDSTSSKQPAKKLSSATMGMRFMQRKPLDAANASPSSSPWLCQGPAAVV